MPPGRYTIPITANPPFTPQGGEPCPYLDGRRLCHMLPESNYENNVGQVEITIPDHPGRSGAAPLAGTRGVAEPADCEDKTR